MAVKDEILREKISRAERQIAIVRLIGLAIITLAYIPFLRSRLGEWEWLGDLGLGIIWVYTLYFLVAVTGGFDSLLFLKTAIKENDAVVSSGALPGVWDDESQLVRQFQNLIANAIKFHRPQEPPRIEIRAEPQGGQILFAVKDNGIGLAIYKRIVERHSGRIWAESAPGQGSTFYFTLPSRQP